MKKPLIAAVLLASSLLSACGGGNSSDPTSPPVTPPVVDPNPVESAINSELKNLSYSASKASADGFVDVEIGPNDISLHLNLLLEDASKVGFISEIRDPDNAVIYRADLDINTGDINSIVSDFADTPYGGEGDFSIYLPSSPKVEIKEGNYRFTFIREDNSPLRKVNALVKSIPAGTTVDTQTYKANLNVWIAHPEPEFSSDAFKLLVNTEYKDSINRILAPHALSIDAITFYTATDTQKQQFADLDVENGLESACLAMLADTENKLAFNLIYVRDLVDEDGESAAAGVSPAPGTLLDNNAGNGCFFVAQQAYVAEPENGFTQDLANQMMAGNILHEASHFMSLEHPTEANGDDFDFFDDTPECDAATFDGRDNPQFGVPGELDGELTDFECGEDGGASNFLFYGGVPQFLPFIMSLDQAKTVRRYPLFTRVN